MRLNSRLLGLLRAVGIWLGVVVLLSTMTADYWYNRFLLKQRGQTAYAEVTRRFAEIDVEYRFEVEGAFYSGYGKLLYGGSREIASVRPGDSIRVSFLPTDPTIHTLGPLEGGRYAEAIFFLGLSNLLGIVLAVGIHHARRLLSDSNGT